MSKSLRIDPTNEELVKSRIHKVLVPYYLKPAAISAIENDIWSILEDEAEA